jgi:hypothetical protein
LYQSKSDCLYYFRKAKNCSESIVIMMGGIGIPQNPQAAMARRPKPEDAASHITVR